MYIWEICLVMIICVLPLGFFLRKYVDDELNNDLPWINHSKMIMGMIKERNSFVWFLLCSEGIISNISLLVLIISIPIYFIWGI